MTDVEIQANAETFRNGLSTKIATNITTVINKNADKIDRGYAGLTCLQSIRHDLLDNSHNEGALGFFYEAQSDGLTSQVLILSGFSRSAMKSLRSLIENIVRSIYYADHPVEYRLWEIADHRPMFKDLFNYVENHPDIKGRISDVNPASSLHGNWKKLSEAVHASAKSQRMSEPDGPGAIWKVNQKSVGEWHSFQKNVMKDVCLLYIILHAEKMQGASLSSLRESLSIAIPKTLDNKIRSSIGVRLIRK